MRQFVMDKYVLLQGGGVGVGLCNKQIFILPQWIWAERDVREGE